jgi:hypothetical protein
MPHSLVLALFDDTEGAARAAKELRGLGLSRERVSVVARSHAEEGVLSSAADASPGSELEDSRTASRLGELGAHFIAAVALVLPGIGPIVADGPLAAELGEAAGHFAGGIARMLVRAGLAEPEARQWEASIESGAFLIGAHVASPDVGRVGDALGRNGATHIAVGHWN